MSDLDKRPYHLKVEDADGNIYLGKVEDLTVRQASTTAIRIREMLEDDDWVTVEYLNGRSFAIIPTRHIVSVELIQGVA